MISIAITIWRVVIGVGCPPAGGGESGDSLALFNEGGVTLLHLGMI